ncbi:hypothetical protein BH24ACT13_BH24ACT13_00730 [soil metagenome]
MILATRLASRPATHRARGLVSGMACAAVLLSTGCSVTASRGTDVAGSSDPPAAPAATGAPTLGATPGGTSSAPPSAPPSASPSATPSTTPTATPVAATLPRGGREIFPRYRLVGFAGNPGAEEFGKLGIGDLDDRARDIEKQAKPYARKREILPVFELIATVAHRTPGADGMFRSRASNDLIRTYLKAARRAKALLLLNIQPGRADFLPEVKAYKRWLRKPDVGIALDPEWAVDPGQVPGQSYGNTTGKELDEVASYLAEVIAEYDLPEKAMVFHEVADSVVREESKLRSHDGVVPIKSVDGIGSPGAKRTTWRALTDDLPKNVHPGFKLFYVEDVEFGPLMTPREVLRLKPTPEYVLYE